MNKYKFTILIIALSVFSFGFTRQDSTSKIKMVLKSMNEYYIGNAVSMSYEIEYTKLDNTIEKEHKTKIYLQNTDYLSENKSELILKNASYYIVVDKEEQTIGLQKAERKQEDNQTAIFSKSFEKQLAYYKEKSITETTDCYVIKLKELYRETILTISKKNYHLVKFDYVFSKDKYLKEVSVKYSNVQSKKQFKKNFFSENKVVKISRKRIVGVGSYRSYRVLNSKKT